MGLEDFIGIIPKSEGNYIESPKVESIYDHVLFQPFPHARHFEMLRDIRFEMPWDTVERFKIVKRLWEITDYKKPIFPVIDSPVDLDPTKKFEPNETLVSLMTNNAVDLDKHIWHKLEEVGDYLYEQNAESEVGIDYFKAQISSRIEGLFSILARYNEGKKEHVLISESGKLTIHFREEVQKWLDLDNYNLREVWDLLYKQLSILASSPRDRVWGKLTKDANDNIMLLIDPKEEFEIINPSDIDGLA